MVYNVTAATVERQIADVHWSGSGETDEGQVDLDQLDDWTGCDRAGVTQRYDVIGESHVAECRPCRVRDWCLNEKFKCRL